MGKGTLTFQFQIHFYLSHPSIIPSSAIVISGDELIGTSVSISDGKALVCIRKISTLLIPYLYYFNYSSITSTVAAQ